MFQSTSRSNIDNKENSCVLSAFDFSAIDDLDPSLGKKASFDLLKRTDTRSPSTGRSLSS